MLFPRLLLLLASIMTVTAGIKGDEHSRSAFLQAYPGNLLRHHVIARYHVTCELTCATKCLGNSACLSFNYIPINKLKRSIYNCQLNDANRVTDPQSYLIKSHFIYYEVLKEQAGKEIADDEQLSYDLTFPNKGLTSYVSLTWPEDTPVNMFTVCFWMKTADQDDGAPFSYSVPNAIDAVTIQKNLLYINDEAEDTSLGDYYDGVWRHICVSWRNSDGSWRVFVDGAVINCGNDFQKGHVIKTGGVLLVGQEQDKAFGDPSGFSFSQSFMGSISGMNVWNKALNQDKILRMSKTCDEQVGNVLRWPDFQIALHGDVIVESPSSCKVPYA